MTTEFELVLATESKVLSTNLQTFEQQANHYLATLTQTFETDDDFAAAKEEVKTLEALEKKTRAAIDGVLNGSKEIADLIDTAKAIADRFRQERLARDKLVKAKEAEVKKRIAETALAEIATTRDQLAKPSDISLALEITLSKATIAKRIEEAQKNKRTIDGLTKAVNAEKDAIIREMASEIIRLTNRLEQLNAKCAWLFPDAVKLIASEDDLAPIITQRLEAERRREAELKAQAEQEAKAKAEAEKVQTEARAIADEMEAQQAVTKSQEIAKTEPTEPLADFVITIRLTQTTQSQAVATARELKEQFGDCVVLNKAK